VDASGDLADRRMGFGETAAA